MLHQLPAKPVAPRLASAGRSPHPTASGDPDRTPSASDTTEVRCPPRRPAADRGAFGLLVVAAPQPALIGCFFPLQGEELVVGRGTEVAVRVDDGGISRRHVRVARGAGGEVVAHDLGSTNGTFVNGVKLRSAVLAPGDRIQLGTGTELLFGPVGQAGAQEEARLRQALAASGVGAWEWDARSGVLSLAGAVGRDAARGAERTDPPGDDPWSRLHQDDRALLRERLQALQGAGARLELELRVQRADGGWGWLALNGEAFAGAEGGVGRAAGTAMDVTDRKRAEEELRRQSLLLDSLSDGVMAVGLDGTILEWNARAQAMLGWSRAEAVGRRPGDLLAAGSQDDLGEAVLGRAARGERTAEERLLRHRDGRELAVEVVAVPLRDGDGHSMACVAILRDVDERRRLLERLQLSERLAALGTLSAGVAHEINNPLAFLTSNLSWVKRRVAEATDPAWEEVASALSDCQEGAERIRTIVSDLRTYASRSPRSEEGPVDVGAVLEFALRVADNDLRHRARVVRALQPVPRVLGGHARLGQVFLNLLVNAAQAIAPGRVEENRIRITTRHDQDRGRVLVEVQDSGAGMDRDTLARAFDPFFTTRPVGSGTGLGLSICHGIVTGLGGEIAVESEPGQGTTFRVWLPVAVPEPAARPARARVLVVDDEPLMGLSVQRMLAGRYEVVACSDPREALRRIEGGDRFDLLILDLAMPEMSGMEVYRRVREVDPRLGARVVVVHGGSIDDVTRDLLRARSVPRVPKPFDMARLAAVVDALAKPDDGG